MIKKMPALLPAFSLLITQPGEMEKNDIYNLCFHVHLLLSYCSLRSI